jgi:hypothetical protein
MLCKCYRKLPCEQGIQLLRTKCIASVCCWQLTDL